jgi:hypothetical protein
LDSAEASPSARPADGPTATAQAQTRRARRRLAVVATAVIGLTGGFAIALADPEGEGAPPSFAAIAPPGTFEVEIDVADFHKGNLHTHSLVSDGDSHPLDVYAWYRDRGYQFVALTDHNTRVEPKVYAHLERPGFKILAGEEVTMTGAGKQVHVNGICTKHRIGGGKFDTQAEALRWAIGQIREQGAVALINHPNFDWALDEEAVFAGRDAPLLEIHSGHPYVWSKGDEARSSHELLWGRLLDRGARFAGAAVDDTHHITTNPAPRKAARPGRGWVSVYAEPGGEVDREATCRALLEGRFYSSSGAALDRLRVVEGTITVWPSDPHAEVTFIGRGNEPLAAVRPGLEGASYTLRGGETLVRVRVDEDDGGQAWTQAFHVATPVGAPRGDG